MPASDLLRRAFLRAYAHEALGLTKTYSYPALARWLTDLGYPTKETEPRSAKSQKVVLGCVPRTEEVMALFERLQAEFPGGGVGGVTGGALMKGLLPCGCSSARETGETTFHARLPGCVRSCRTKGVRPSPSRTPPAAQQHSSTRRTSSTMSTAFVY